MAAALHDTTEDAARAADRRQRPRDDAGSSDPSTCRLEVATDALRPVVGPEALNVAMKAFIFGDTKGESPARCMLYALYAAQKHAMGVWHEHEAQADPKRATLVMPEWQAKKV